RKILEQVVALEGAGHAHPADPVGRAAGDVLAGDKDAPGAWRELPADLVDQAGFAGAVWTDDDVPFARDNVEADVVGDDKAAERAIETVDPERSHDRTLFMRMSRIAPQMPAGKNITQQMKVMPM